MVEDADATLSIILLQHCVELEMHPIIDLNDGILRMWLRGEWLSNEHTCSEV